MSAIVVECRVDEVLSEDVECSIIINRRVATLVEMVDSLSTSFETRESVSMSTIHHLHHHKYFVLMFTNSFESLEEHFPKVFEVFTILLLEHFHVFLVEFERDRVFKPFARRIGNEEPKVNVNYMTLSIY